MWGEASVWFLAGMLLSAVNMLLILAFVARMHQAQVRRLRRYVWSSYAVRYGLAALLLFLAVRRSVSAGLAVAGGVWVARWVGIYLGLRGRLSWTWLG